MDFILYVIIVLLSVEQVVNVPAGRRRKLQPTFLPTPTNITVHRGQVAVLKCHIKYVGPMVVVWREQGKDIPLTIGDAVFSAGSNIAIEEHIISDQETHLNLIIKDVETKHSGIYVCQISGPKLNSQNVILTVLEEPVKNEKTISVETPKVSRRDEPVKVEKSIKLTGTEFVNQDSRITLRCNVTGALHAPDDVDWFFDGKRVVTSLPRWRDRTHILRRTMGKMYISELIVERSTLKDHGIYVCRGFGSSIDVERIAVNVLSDNQDLSEINNTVASSSASVAFQDSSQHLILTLLSSALISLTSNKLTILTTQHINFSMFLNVRKLCEQLNP